MAGNVSLWEAIMGRGFEGVRHGRMSSHQMVEGISDSIHTFHSYVHISLASAAFLRPL